MYMLKGFTADCLRTSDRVPKGQFYKPYSSLVPEYNPTYDICWYKSQNVIPSSVIFVTAQA